MIARDEEGSIGLAIKSALALVDEVIVVDTGSVDNTRIIAEGYGARVVDFAWRDDFAAARNTALDEAFGDWVLVLDADERLQPLRPIDFQRLLNTEGIAAYRLEVAGRQDETPSGRRQVRLFRNHAEIRWRYPVHEQVLPALAPWAASRELRIEDAPIVILHAGALRDRRAEKRDRNLRILRRAVQEQPSEPYFEYQLACESLTQLDDEILPVAGLGQSLGLLDRAWQKLAARRGAPPPEWAADLAAKIAGAHLALGATAAALAGIEAGRRLCGEAPALLLAGVATNTRHLTEAAADLPAAAAQRLARATREAIDRLLAGDCPGPVPADERCLTLYPLRYRGELALLSGQVELAAESFEKALTIDAAYSSAWLGLAECARYAGDRKRALQLYLRAVTASEWNHRAWLRGSGVLDELGFHDNAESWRRQVANHFPEHPAESGAGGEARPLLQTT